MKNSSRESLLCEVANLYYNKGLTQAEIAKAMYISRSSISRLLQEARDCGLVEIRIAPQSERCYYLEGLLCKHFGIKEAYIYDYSSAEASQVFNSLCSNAANYLSTHMDNCSVFGISRGSVVDRIFDNLKPQSMARPELKLVQMHGCESSSVFSHSSESLMRRMLNIYGGTAYYLNAPMYVKSEALKEQLESEPSISPTLDLIEKVDMAITGIGSLSGNWHETSFLSQYIDERTISELIANGCVGHIFGQFFDINGSPVDHDINRRRIGINFDCIPRIPRVISVVYGADRAQAVLGAMRGHLTNIVFMDKLCAERILELNYE